MEPKITRRQQIVKNITIVFLLVLLVLTFFSNTIMNMTLPEVMLGEIRPETITTQVYASGIVQANDVYQLTMTESRVVESISVSEGAAVREGDVLFYLEGEEDENLKSMIRQRDALELEYNKMILTNRITEAELQTVIAGGMTLQHTMGLLAQIKDEAKYQETLNRHILYMELYEKYKELNEYREQIAQSEANAMGSQVVSPINGTILDIEIVSGKRAERDALAMTIFPEGQNLYMEVELPAEDADAISATTQIQVSSPSELAQTSFVFRDARVDPASVDGGKIVTFDVQGESVRVGQNFSIVINRRSEQYEMVVSSGAVRQDREGFYVLKLNQESSSLGSHYYAERVEVQVLAESDSKKAISGALYGDEYLIVDSNAPVQDGQQVRLADE